MKVRELMTQPAIHIAPWESVELAARMRRTVTQRGYAYFFLQ